MSWREALAKAVLAGRTGGPHPGGIRAYHSSPYDFDRFDFSKIGTGEGAQVYGHGAYLAENPAVSGQGGQYWNSFRDRFSPAENEATRYLANHKFDRDAAAAEAQDVAKYYRQKAKEEPLQATNWNMRANMIEGAHDLLRSDKSVVGPRTYEVNINARPDLFLDWDKPLKQQPQIVERLPMLTEAARQEAHDRAIAATSPRRAEELWGMVKNPLEAAGGIAYQKLAGKFGGTTQLAGGRYSAPFTNPEAASAAMAEAGIPGIRYLDEGSRGIPADLDYHGRIADQYRKTIASMEDDLARNADNPSMTPAYFKVTRKWLADTRNDLAKTEATIAGLGQPTHNYVVFDPSNLDIMAKYGVVGGVPLGMGALAAQDQYGAQQ